MSEAGVKLGRLKSLGLSTLEEVTLSQVEWMVEAVKSNQKLIA